MSTKQISIKYFAMAFLILSMSGCRLDMDLPDATKNIENAAKELNQGLTNLDPVALNKLLSENTLLRNQLKILGSQINGLTTGEGVIHLKGKKLQLRVIQYTGTHRLNGWVDNGENWNWKNRRFNDKDIRLVLDDLNIWKRTYNAKDPNKLYTQHSNIRTMHSQAKHDVSITGCFRVADQPRYEEFALALASEYQSEVDRLFTEYLKTAALIPGPDTRTIDLHDQLLTLGDHTVSIEVTPIATDKNNRWSLRGQIITTNAQGKEDVLKEFDIDSDLYNNHQLNTPLPAVNALIRVEQSPQ